jgi:hypothetical protein
MNFQPPQNITLATAAVADVQQTPPMRFDTNDN